MQLGIDYCKIEPTSRSKNTAMVFNVITENGYSGSGYGLTMKH